MDTLVRWIVLVAFCAAGAWAGRALSRPAAAGAGPAPLPAKPSLGDLDGPPLPAAKAAREDEALHLTFADLSQWDLDPQDVQVPASVAAYGGKEIDIVGYMIPYGNPEAIEEFVLVKDLGSCCFGQAPQPHHLIECRFVDGKKCAYVAGPVRVRGKFRVEEHRQGKFLVSVFALSATECVEVR